MANNNPQPHLLPVERLAIVSSAEDQEDDTNYYNMSDDDPSRRHHPSQPLQREDLYGANLDDEDEAWVYKHMRSGVEETVPIQQQQVQRTKTLQQQDSQAHYAKLLKPRSSDAVLSCPCCFTVVCMDCQRHERYENQYRAMFVMNIGVSWDTQLVYCDKSKTLVEKPKLASDQSDSTASTTTVQQDRGRSTDTSTSSHHVPIVDGPALVSSMSDEEEVYYPVYCLSCQTQVAALDMRDEVYHFFGCCASA